MTDNIKMTKKGDKLVIEIDISKDYGLSGSGKSKIIASTRGNQSVKDTPFKIGLNIYERV